MERLPVTWLALSVAAYLLVASLLSLTLLAAVGRLSADWWLDDLAILITLFLGVIALANARWAFSIVARTSPASPDPLWRIYGPRLGMSLTITCLAALLWFPLSTGGPTLLVAFLFFVLGWFLFAEELRALVTPYRIPELERCISILAPFKGMALLRNLSRQLKEKKVASSLAMEFS